MDLARGAGAPSEPSLNTIAAQVATAQEGLGTIRRQLDTKNLSLKSSQQRLLGNKLGAANEYLQAANTKLGGEPPAPSARAPGSGPVGKFLAMVSDGENQLQAVGQQLNAVSKKGLNFSPADMLLVQVKMGLAQQEIEFSSVLLSKVIDSLKTIMNTPL